MRRQLASVRVLFRIGLSADLFRSRAPARGNPRRFDVRDVDRVALISALVTTGLPVGEAAKAASAFSDERSKYRPRAQLHKEGKTILVIDKDCARVVNAHEREEFESLMAGMFSSDHGGGGVERQRDVAQSGRGPSKARTRRSRRLVRSFGMGGKCSVRLPSLARGYADPWCPLAPISKSWVLPGDFFFEGKRKTAVGLRLKFFKVNSASARPTS